MEINKYRIVFIIVMFACLSSIALAGPTYIFDDDFDSENGGNYQLNYTGFDNWVVSDGSVDLIGEGSPYDYQPGHGLYVDMDGSSNDAGLMTSSIALDPGQYLLSFELAGNHRNNDNESVAVLVELGSLVSQTYSLNQNDPFTLYENYFTVDSVTTVSLSFEGAGSDNVGMLLDNVKIQAVPVPGAFLLGGIGVGIAGWLKSRRSL